MRLQPAAVAKAAVAAVAVETVVVAMAAAETVADVTADATAAMRELIARIPRGDEAVRLWDAVELIATTSGVAELKRSNRNRPSFD